MDNSIGSTSAGGVSAPSAGGFSGTDTSFENPASSSEISDVEIVQPIEETEVFEAPKSDTGSIMEIPGTAHDKLQTLADMDEEFEESEVVNSDDKVTEEEKPKANVREEKPPEFIDTKEPSIEQKIILAQAKALKFLAKSLDGKGKDKEKEELLKKLKQLLEELEESKDGNRASLTGAVLGVILLLLNSAEKGTKQLEKEVKRAQ